MRLLAYGVLLANLPMQAFAQQTIKELYVKNDLQYIDATYHAAIKSVQLRPLQNSSGYPVIPLQTERYLQTEPASQLLLTFDELGEHTENYSYTIIYCNADWTPSTVEPFDYLYGFTEADITDVNFSFNTLQPYTHYRLVFPNVDIGPLQSGNYLLKVFKSGNNDDVIITRRFMVYEQVVHLSLQSLAPLTPALRHTHHRMDFEIDTRRLDTPNPLAEVVVHILQNGRWDNALLHVKPTFLRNEKLYFSRTDKLRFPAGHQFRYFDSRTLRFLSERVDRLAVKNNQHHLWLKPDIPTSARNAAGIRIGKKDNNGRFQIGVFDGKHDQLDADYTWVHFNLKVNKPFSEGNIYIMGALTNWQTSADNLMHYNDAESAYQASLYLKQGFYNYQYAMLTDGGSTASAKPMLQHEQLEGNFYTTENDYLILVYFRAFNTRTDRLVGFKNINTIN